MYSLWLGNAIVRYGFHLPHYAKPKLASSSYLIYQPPLLHPYQLQWWMNPGYRQATTQLLISELTKMLQ